MKPKLIFGQPIPNELIPKEWICPDCGNKNINRMALDICLDCGSGVILIYLK